MFGRFRNAANAIYSAINLDPDASGAAAAGAISPQHTNGHPETVGVGGAVGGGGGGGKSGANRVKYAYQRPIFLQLFTDDEIQVTADHLVRPIMVPRDINILPWHSGYAEAINAGKSLRNEDQAAFHRGVLRACDLPPEVEAELDDALSAVEIPYVYFATFDGHAGSGCAVAAANELHQVLHHKLAAVLQHLIPHAVGSDSVTSVSGNSAMWFPTREISCESLVIGALESAFWEMDQQIGEDKRRYKMLGGCTVIVSLFILGKLYVSNAGDSRSVLCRDGRPYPMSFDFTPVSERQRLQQLGYQKPQLLGGEYSHLDYCRRPLRKDVGKRMLYRDQHMTGWTYKEITQDDLKFPVVYGEGKRSRLLATIGVTRGFGDHDLKAQSQNGAVYIKPFLTPQPEVRVLDVEREAVTDADVLIMATDGLWDVVSNEAVAEVVASGLKLYEDADDSRKKYRYISIAQDLVMSARGKLQDRAWRRSDGTAATIDDISVLVVPVKAYKEEYRDWRDQLQERLKREKEVRDQREKEAEANANNIEEALEVEETLKAEIERELGFKDSDEEEEDEDAEVNNEQQGKSSKDKDDDDGEAEASK